MAETETIEQPEVVEPEVKVEKPSREDHDRLQQEQASKNGWKDFDAYVEEGGDPAKWRTADAFNLYGEVRSTLTRKEQEFNQRIEGVQKLAQAQMEAQRQDLLSQREELIEAGGKSKEVKALDRQIDTLNAAPIQQAVVPPLLQQWNESNAWIDEDSPKAAYARKVFGEQHAMRVPLDQALQAVDAAIKKHYPPQSKAATIPESEHGRGPKGFKAQPKGATMDTLTNEEKRIWNLSSSMWKGDQKAFLQSVTDSRKAEGK